MSFALSHKQTKRICL